MNPTTTAASAFSRSEGLAVSVSDQPSQQFRWQLEDVQVSSSLDEIEPTERALRLIEEGMKELEAGDTVEFADVRARVKARRHGS